VVPVIDRVLDQLRRHGRRAGVGCGARRWRRRGL